MAKKKRVGAVDFLWKNERSLNVQKHHAVPKKGGIVVQVVHNLLFFQEKK